MADARAEQVQPRALRLLGAVVWLLLFAGCVSPPTPQTGCRLDTECASGRCLGGVCVTEDAAQDVNAADEVSAPSDVALDSSDAEVNADAPDERGDIDGSGDGVSGDSGDGAVGSCTTDAECQVWLGDAEPCLAAECSAGKCVALPLADATTCTTSAFCPEPGACSGGTCKATAKACDDGEPCTIDTCDLPGGCSHTPKPDGPGGCDGSSACTIGVCTAGVCDPNVVASGMCAIGGVCYQGGASQPGKPCARCFPENAKTGWTFLGSGSCDDGDACTQGDLCIGDGDCAGSPVTCTDDNPCTDNSCDPATGCVALPNQATCDDGDLCSLTESCKNGACIPTAWNACDDDNVCTSDQCDIDLGCVHTPAAGPCQFDTDPCTTDECVGGACTGVPLASVCTIGGVCMPAGTSADGQPCLVCDPNVAEDAWTPLNNKDCDDGNACTAGDLCYGGACIGAVGLCDDKNPCTKNNCTPSSGCVFLPVNVPCDDGNECTSGDDCATGKCVGLAMAASACDDNNPCTDDSCLPVAGCAHAPNLLACNDGNACTSGDFCTAGVCHGAHVTCGCTQASDCDDGNPCSVDICDSQGTCANAPISAGACDDGNACTSGDHCAKGYCLGVTIACNDNEACSLDGCVPATGCVFLPLQGVSCNDGNACTTGDLCVNGACSGTLKNCDDAKPCTADTCKASNGKCEHAQLPEGTTCTADGAECTIDACVGGTCNHSAIVPGLCRIEGVCVSAGTLAPGQVCLGCVPESSQGTWSVIASATCTDGNACTNGDACGGNGLCSGIAVACDDGNPCTYDLCNPLASPSGTPCLFAPSVAACDDGDPCTKADTCALGQCGGTPVSCDDGNSCTSDTCVSHVGCQSTPNPGTTNCSDDGIACTQDLCAGATCSHAVAPGKCLIGGACRDEGASASADPCETCQPAVSTSTWTPATGTTCDDGNPCTAKDLCSGGTCTGTGSASCDDGNGCTADACMPLSGCQHQPLNGTACSDGNTCTTNDVCSIGVCQPGTATICAQPASNSCAIAACDPPVGCHFVSTCNALEACYQGACTTLDATGLPAPVTVPLDNGVAPQPLTPTLMWQPGNGVGLAGLPRLRLAVQTRGCAPSIGLYSTVAVASLPPNQAPVQWQMAPVVPPPTASGWCALNPQFVTHNADGAALLAWTEGGNTASPCDVLATGGALHVTHVAADGYALTNDVLAACPAAGGVVSRPAVFFDVWSGGLTGVLARATQDGVRLWQGLVVGKWGNAGAPVAAEAGQAGPASVLNVRPILIAGAPGGPLLATLSEHETGAEPVYAVDVTAVTADAAAPIATQTALIAGQSAATMTYRTFDAVWDPDAQQVAVLVSGSLVYGGAPMAFLAVAQTTPGAPLGQAPVVVRLFAAASGLTAPPAPHAIRLAEIPGSTDLLVAVGAADGMTLEILRVHPQISGLFEVTASRVLANDFVSHETGDAVTGFGGLSELAISPDGTTVSIAYESVGAVRLVTVAVP